MLGDDLIEEVLKAVNTCTIPSGWNDTAIVMIPKVNSPEKVDQLVCAIWCIKLLQK